MIKNILLLVLMMSSLISLAVSAIDNQKGAVLGVVQKVDQKQRAVIVSGNKYFLDKQLVVDLLRFKNSTYTLIAKGMSVEVHYHLVNGKPYATAIRQRKEKLVLR